ncbi:hypothetical protein AnigIFM50267_002918 [Aspergillus niger]|nr:hypothetical protein AnigIFM50267_002918 [Aspergillus niger]
MLVDVTEKPWSKTGILQNFPSKLKTVNTRRMPNVCYANKVSFLSIDKDHITRGIPTNVREVPGVTPRKIGQ